MPPQPPAAVNPGRGGIVNGGLRGGCGACQTRAEPARGAPMPIAPFPLARPRRLRRTPWIRDLVAEARLAPRRPHLADLRARGAGRRRAGGLAAGGRAADDRPRGAGGGGGGGARDARASRSFPIPRTADKNPEATEAWNPENLVCRATRAIKAAVPEVGVLLDVALDPVQFRRPRRAGARRGGAERRDAAGAGEDGAGAGRGRLRHPRAVGHDGRADRGDPPGARGARLPRHGDHELRGQVRLGLLRAVPRRGGLGRGAQGRQEDLPDGPARTATRRCARWRPTSPRGRTW